MTIRLAPTTTRDTAWFWDALREHKLLIQRCVDCGAVRHPPRPMCPNCNSLAWDTLETSGRGTVYSYVVPQHPRFPHMEYPYVVVLVELDDGIRLVSNLCGVALGDILVGMPVEVFFETFEDDVVLHQFRPLG